MDSPSEALQRVLAFLPDLVAGLIVLAIGWLIAIGLGRLVRAVLPRVGFDRFLSRHGLQPSARHRDDDDAKKRREGSYVVGTLVIWGIFLVALMEAASIWGLDILARGLANLIAYIPNAIAAAVIFGAAYVIGNWVADRLRSSRATGETSYASIVPSAVRAAILTLGAFLALNELIIAPEILFLAFALTLGAIAVAVALAFGLGGREAARRMANDWYEANADKRRMATATAGSRGRGEARVPEGPEEPGLH